MVKIEESNRLGHKIMKVSVDQRVEEISKRLANKDIKATKLIIKAILNEYEESIVSDLEHGMEVGTKFGVLRTYVSKPTTRLNPKTGTKIDIPAMTRPKITFSSRIKNTLKTVTPE